MPEKKDCLYASGHVISSSVRDGGLLDGMKAKRSTLRFIFLFDGIYTEVLELRLGSQERGALVRSGLKGQSCVAASQFWWK